MACEFLEGRHPGWYVYQRDQLSTHNTGAYMQTIPHNLIMNLLVQEHVPYQTCPINVASKSTHIMVVFNWLACDEKILSLRNLEIYLQHKYSAMKMITSSRNCLASSNNSRARWIETIDALSIRYLPLHFLSL
jgi:hypothetical protein